MKMWITSVFRKKMNPADLLSLYRIVSAPVFIVLLFTELRLVYGILLAISFFTDAIDGFIARKFNFSSPRGAQLDSIADATLFVVGVAGVIRFETAFVSDHLTVILIATGIYLFQLLLGYWRYGKPSSFHTYMAKVAAVVQGIFILWTIFLGAEPWLFYGMLGISVLETLEEIMLIFMFKEWKTNVKGLFWLLRSGGER